MKFTFNYQFDLWIKNFKLGQISTPCINLFYCYGEDEERKKGWEIWLTIKLIIITLNFKFTF